MQLLDEMETQGLNYLSNIETEKLLKKQVEEELGKRKKVGTYTTKKSYIVCHFLSYQCRGSLPSNFDCNYAFTLGQLAFFLVMHALNGYMATVTNLNQPISKWRCGAVPFTAMMTLRRQPKDDNDVITGELAVHSEKVVWLLESETMKKCSAVIQIVVSLILMVGIMGVMAACSALSVTGVNDPACCNTHSSATNSAESYVILAIVVGALLLF